MSDRKRAKDNPTHQASRRKTANLIAFIVAITAWLILSNIISQFIVGYPMAWILGATMLEPFWTLIYYILNYTVAIALVCLVPVAVLKLWRKRNHKKTTTLKKAENELSTSPAELGVNKYPTFVDIGLAPIGYIIYLVTASILTQIIAALFPAFDVNQAQDVGFNAIFTFSDRMFAILAVVLIAPVAEEIMMRGWLYGKLRSKLHGAKGVIIAIFITSLAFAVMHGQLNVGVSVFVLSSILCLLREVTGSIWSGLLVHMLTNGVAFYMVYILMGA